MGWVVAMHDHDVLGAADVPLHLRPGAPIPSLAEVHACVLEDLLAHESTEIASAAGRLQSELGLPAIEDLDTQLALEGAYGAYVASLLTRLEPSKGGQAALRLMAAASLTAERHRAFLERLEPLRPFLARAAGGLANVAVASSPLRAWEPHPSLPPAQWALSPLGDLDDDAIFEAMATGHRIDGMAVLARALLPRAKAVEMGAWVPSAVDIPREDPAASRILAGARHALAGVREHLPAALVIDAIRRGWDDSTAALACLKTHPAIASPEAKGAALLRAAAPQEITEDPSALAWLLEDVDRVGADAAQITLTRLLDDPAHSQRLHAAKIVSKLDAPTRQTVIDATLPGLASEAERRGNRLTVQAATELLRGQIALAPAEAARRFVHAFDDTSLASRPALARMVLALRSPRRSEPLFERDPQWIDLAAKALTHVRTSEAARAFLATFDPTSVERAVDLARSLDPDAPWGKPAPQRVRPKKRAGAAPAWLERYRDGAMTEVWSEIVEHGPNIREPKLLAEAEQVAALMMQRVRDNVVVVIKRLSKEKLSLLAGSPKKAAPGPGAKPEKVLKKLDKALGVPLPLSVAAFWHEVGPVDLRIDRDASGAADLAERAARADAFVATSAKDALAHLDQARVAEARYPGPLRRPTDRILFAPAGPEKSDPHARISRFAELLVTSQGAEATLVGASEPESFVAYLRRTVLEGGGFADPDALGDEELVARLTHDLQPF